MVLEMDYKSSPKAFFDAYHELYHNENDLINPKWHPYMTKYHYNMVENGIIDLLTSSMDKITSKTVLDVGTGTGHWVEFYKRHLEASTILGVDFSEVAIKKVSEKITDITNCSVAFKQMDVTEFDDTLVNEFDIVNAIGVMFHIIDDSSWAQAVRNLCSYIRKGGTLVVGGDFGSITGTISHHRRVRSLDDWCRITSECGMRHTGSCIFNNYDIESKALRNNLVAFVKGV